MSTGTQHAMSSEMQDCISNCMTCLPFVWKRFRNVFK